MYPAETNIEDIRSDLADNIQSYNNFYSFFGRAPSADEAVGLFSQPEENTPDVDDSSEVIGQQPQEDFDPSQFDDQQDMGDFDPSALDDQQQSQDGFDPTQLADQQSQDGFDPSAIADQFAGDGGGFPGMDGMSGFGPQGNEDSEGRTHTISEFGVIKNISFNSYGDGDVLDVSPLLENSNVDESNLDQYVKVTPMAAFVDSFGSGQFSQINQVARFTGASRVLLRNKSRVDRISLGYS